MKKQKNKKSKKVNILLMLLAVLAAVLCIILPEYMIDIKKKEYADVYMKVPEEYYPTSSYYEVTKASSEKLTEYQKRQLITGQWESEITEVDKEYYEDSGYHIEERVKSILDELYEEALYPVHIDSGYSDWYNWKCTYMQALDTNFRSYAGFFWRVEFTHYENSEKLTVYITSEGSIVEMIYRPNEGEEIPENPEVFSDVQIINMTNMMLGENIRVKDVTNVSTEKTDQIIDYLEKDRLIEEQDRPDDSSAGEDIDENQPIFSILSKKIVTEDAAGGDETWEYYFYSYRDDHRMITGFLPVEQ